MKTAQNVPRVGLALAKVDAGNKSKAAYSSWRAMMARCFDVNNISYPRYGGRGITVYEPWRRFASFYADMGERPAGMSLERIDNSKNYEPGNCKWATRWEQAQNTRKNVVLTFAGHTAPLSVWANELGVNHKALASRIQRGWTVDRAITQRFKRNDR